MFELIVAGFMFVALIFYAVTGDADYGGGMWDLLATGPRAGAQRSAIERAIGPIWEADHVWLILIVVILFTGFPSAFAAMMTALNIPFTLMLIGIVLRGSAFIFRKYDIKACCSVRPVSLRPSSRVRCSVRSALAKSASLMVVL
jgi:cytochrome bd ubiquinol oxidase subunit II